MSKEERAIYFNQLIIPDLFDNSQEACELRMKQEMALRETIKELEQEPCDDVISREFLLKCIETDFRTKKIPVPSYIIGIIKSAPPITPQPKVGYWIVKGESWYCSQCDEPICEIYDGKPYEKYCPNCGAKMKEVEE